MTYNRIPLNRQVVEFYMPTFGSAFDALQRIGVNTLEDINTVKETDFISVKGMSTGKWKKVGELKNILNHRSTEVEEYFTYCVQQHEFPALDPSKTDYTLDEMAAMAISQLIDHLDKASKYNKSYTRLQQLIENLILNDFTTEELMKRFGVTTKERIRQLRISLKNQFQEGRFDGIHNLTFSDEFLCALKSLRNNLPVYSSITTLNEAVGCNDFDSSLIRFFLDVKRVHGEGQFYTRYDQAYYIPTEQPVEEVSKYIDTLIGIMSNNKDAEVRPMTFGQIMDSLIEHYPDVDFDSEIVEDILNQHAWIQKVEEGDLDMYMVEFERLKDYQKIARIVFEHKSVSLQEISQELISRGEEELASRLSNLNVSKQKYPWVKLAGQNGMYEYNPNGGARKTLPAAINEFTMKTKFFTYSELIEHLHAEGFTNLKEKSVRAYIMKTCQSSTDDSNLFCHSDFLYQHRDIKWRMRTQNGLGHWLLTRTIEHLKASGNKSTKDKILSYVKMENPEGYQLRNDLSTYLYPYIGMDELFMVDNNKYYLTARALALTPEELDKLGVRQRTPEYYKDVISFIMSQLKNVEGGQMLLSSIKRECLNSIPEMAEPSFYKIVSTMLPEQISKVEEDCKMYLRLEESKIEYMPSYVIDDNKLDDYSQEEPALVASEEGRITPVPGSRTRFTWEEIREAMSKEFKFYSRWWDIKIPLEEGIDKFIRFMQTQANSQRLTRFIPQSMYEFWHMKNDEMDYYRYMIDITECYEKLLYNVQSANTGTKVFEDGLQGAINASFDFRMWINYSDTKGFLKTFNSLKHIRNKCAHGQDIDTGLMSMIQNTTSFIALYVYTVARFWNE